MPSACWPVLRAASSIASPPCLNVSKLEFAMKSLQKLSGEKLAWAERVAWRPFGAPSSQGCASFPPHSVLWSAAATPGNLPHDLHLSLLRLRRVGAVCRLREVGRGQLCN